MLDLNALEAGLRSDDPRQLEPAWLGATYQRPSEFWTSLLDGWGALFSTPAKTVPFVRYAPFHDVTSRHSLRNVDALVWYDATGSRRALTYSELADRATARAASFAEQGLGKGQMIAIVDHLGPDAAISILAVWRLGAALALVPPTGRGLLQRRIDALAPDAIDAGSTYKSIVDKLGPPTCSRDGAANPEGAQSSEGGAFAPGEIAAAVFDVASDDICQPMHVDAERLCLSAYRDGLIGLGVRRGSVVCAPGFDVLQTQPCLLLSVWLAGGTYLHIDREQLQRDPGVCSQENVSILGVTNEVRDDALTLGWPALHCERWFRDPARSGALNRWQDLVDRLRWDSALSLNIRFEPATGGATLFSQRYKGAPHSRVWRSAGIPWSMVDLRLPDRPATFGVGRLVPGPPDGSVPEEPLAPTQTVVSNTDTSLTCLGPAVVGPRGRRYPIELVVPLLEQLPETVGASACVAPVPGEDLDYEAVLMAFVGGASNVDEADLARRFRQSVVAEIGEDYVPDRLAIYRLFPRRTDEGTIDHDWCRNQHLSGALAVRSRDPLFRKLAHIRELIS